MCVGGRGGGAGISQSPLQRRRSNEERGILVKIMGFNIRDP